jgi:hypothetical protein
MRARVAIAESGVGAVCFVVGLGEPVTAPK